MSTMIKALVEPNNINRAMDLDVIRQRNQLDQQYLNRANKLINKQDTTRMDPFKRVIHQHRLQQFQAEAATALKTARMIKPTLVLKEEKGLVGRLFHSQSSLNGKVREYNAAMRKYHDYNNRAQNAQLDLWQASGNVQFLMTHGQMPVNAMSAYE